MQFSIISSVTFIHCYSSHQSLLTGGHVQLNVFWKNEGSIFHWWCWLQRCQSILANRVSSSSHFLLIHRQLFYSPLPLFHSCFCLHNWECLEEAVRWWKLSSCLYTATLRTLGIRKSTGTTSRMMAFGP